MTEIRTGFFPSHLKSTRKVECDLNGFFSEEVLCNKTGYWQLGQWYRPTQSVCSSQSNLLWEWAEVTCCGSNPAMRFCAGITEFPWPALSEDTLLYSGLLCHTYWKFCRSQSSVSFFFCTHKSLWAKGCCVGQQAQSFHSFSTNPWAPSPYFSSPSLVFYPFFSLSKQEFRELTFLGWWVGCQIQPQDSGHLFPSS